MPEPPPVTMTTCPSNTPPSTPADIGPTVGGPTIPGPLVRSAAWLTEVPTCCNSISPLRR
jgi:hypothetical protein